MGLQHFSHEHPLLFVGDSGEKVHSCNGCLIPISGPSYSCNSDGCEFFLHKLCAELPQEIKHPLHPHHPLTLVTAHWCICDACGGQWEDFTYHCFLCVFNIDIVCAALTERKIEHRSHKHPLTPVRKPALFLCNACGKNHEGFFFLCTTCLQFWIHWDCASLPSTIQHTDHDHPLTLAYSLPPEYSKFEPNCNICSEFLEETCWVYHCARCRYFAHVDCATSEIDTSGYQTEGKRENEVLDPNLIHLPMLDQSVSIISQFVKQFSLGENKPATELNHFTHHHTLILSDVHKMNNDEILCNGCILPISEQAPFYSCATCNFFLHKWCAELPTEVQHPYHPQHPLTLLAKSPKFFALFQCDGCRHHCNGFAFYCAQCQYYLDVKCGSLPRTIIHEAHPNHWLGLRKISNSLCNACGFSIFGSAFGCDTCNFKLHSQCALLPHTVRHRYDTHPLALTYSPIKDHLQEYYCEICEQELNLRHWYYHCGDCDQSFHILCINRLDIYSNIKFGGTLNVDKHPHLLTFVPNTNDNSPCDHCGVSPHENSAFNYLAFICSQCNFKLWFECASSFSKQQTTCSQFPRMVRHQYDLHPLTLTTAPVKDHLEEYCCVVCAEEVNVKDWFYHCGDCDRSFHCECVGWRDTNSNIKFGDTLKVEGHQHLLTFAPNNHKDNPRCDHCGVPTYQGEFFRLCFKCLLCNFKLRFECAFMM